MDIDPNCYTFKRLEAEAGLFDSSVDATYIITLEGNGRYERIMEQLQKYHPTRVLYIMTNRGYKRCKKNLKKDLPRYDLTDAFIATFKHANHQGYRNILVLEDDFIFSDKVFDPKTLSIVNGFVAARTDTNFIYPLGCLPQLQIPYDQYHNIPYIFTGTHAVIYSRSCRDKDIQDYATTTIDDWDSHHDQKLNQYTYHEPLVYQLFPVTENRKHGAASQYMLQILEFFYRLVRLDTDVEPGYSIFYAISKILFYVLLALPILLAGGIAYYMTKKIRRRSK
jgi:hypothetical protein